MSDAAHNTPPLKDTTDQDGPPSLSPQKTPGSRRWVLGLSAVCVLLGIWATLPIWVHHIPQPLSRRLQAWSSMPVISSGHSETQLAALEAHFQRARQDIDQNRYRLAVLEQKKPLTPAENQTPPQTDDRLDPADMVTRIETLEALLHDLENRVQTQSNTNHAVTPQQLDALAARIDAQPGPKALTTLSQRLGNLEKNLRTSPAVKGALFLALGQIKEALNTGQPYDIPLHTTRSLLGETSKVQSALETLARHAPKGLPTRTELSRQLDDLAPQVIRLGYTSSASSSWWGYTLEALSSVVSLRRLDEGLDNQKDPASLVTRATAAARRSDLSAATEDIARLTNQAAVASQAWLQKAQARLEVEHALNILVNEAVTELTVSFLHKG